MALLLGWGFVVKGGWRQGVSRWSALGCRLLADLFCRAAIDEMDAALVHHAQHPLPPEIARTLVEKGALERRAKRKNAAKRTLEQALEMLEPLEAIIHEGAGAG